MLHSERWEEVGLGVAAAACEVLCRIFSFFSPCFIRQKVDTELYGMTIDFFLVYFCSDGETERERDGRSSTRRSKRPATSTGTTSHGN